MTHLAKQPAMPAPKGHQADRTSFLLLFVAAFAMFLAIALVGQALGMPWRSWLPGAEGDRSVTGGVKAAVYTFMSHLQ